MQVPIAFMIFNRPDVTDQVFREIAKAQPPKLFVIADGPRPEQPEKCRNAPPRGRSWNGWIGTAKW